MKDRPILFSAPMVLALLAGTKTQTRRVCKLDHRPGMSEPELQSLLAACPYGARGDRLWVRESFAFTDAHMPDYSGSIEYRADNKCLAVEAGRDLVDVPHGCDPRPFAGPWKPSIHMPRWACRLVLEITGVRVERLQDISEADILTEGITVDRVAQWCNTPWSTMPTLHHAWRVLWESINGAESWTANPWVWVVEFKRIGA